MTDLTLYFDGLCEPAFEGGPRNPGGIACFGWLLLEGGEVIEEGQGVEARGPNATNNVAEWAALEQGLRAASVRHPDRLDIQGDSQLVINQLTGTWRMHAVHLQPYHRRCLVLLDRMGCQWQARWVPREQNEAADALSREAYAQERRRR